MKAELSNLALRALIRNADARIEHLTAWAQTAEPGDLVPVDFPARLQRAQDAAIFYRLQLARRLQLISPAESSLVNVAPSGDAIRPGSL